MDELLTALSQLEAARYLRFSRWAYASVNTTHVLGIALLFGAIISLDLRLMGAWRHVSYQDLARVLIPVAVAGLATALLTGLLLFSVRADEYGYLPVFWAKLVLITLGAASAIAAHARYGRWLGDAAASQRMKIGAMSLVCWTGALIAGRLIAFSGM